MQFDPTTNFIFLGDYSGNVYVLRIAGNHGQLVSKLSAHTASISDLAWDSGRQVLFSASSDTLVIMWDIGGQKGHCYEFK
jgi:WD40 repeat protein